MIGTLKSGCRVVIHPKYRSIGLGAKLIRETLPLAGTPFVELIAVMAKYSPFAEKAGMKKIAEQRASEKMLETSRVLTEMGFDLQLLGSERYVHDKLEGLSIEQVSLLKEAFIKNGHLRFKEIVVGKHQPYGKASAFRLCVEEADLSKIAKLIKIFGMLLQVKIYLFWSKKEGDQS
jgi:hypothetical protein